MMTEIKLGKNGKIFNAKKTLKVDGILVELDAVRALRSTV